MKYFRMSYEEIVFKRSYINIILLNRSIPSYNFEGDEDNGNDKKESLAGRNGKKKTFRHESELFESLM